ncbi:DNA polymerase III [Chitinophaga vietnamensis]|uniref:DNA polymerase III n=1 Tax=Chitinophaga vietnamensis TaxID=2593957 RepID=UPI0011788CE1|nr:DNA polymerase III [Chitinophaga vietnamensis]
MNNLVMPSGRLLLWDAALLGHELQRAMIQLPSVEKVAMAGSLRREKDTVRNIDLVLQVPRSKRAAAKGELSQLAQVQHVISSDEHHLHILGYAGEVVDVYMLDAAEYGAGLLYYTGSVAHNLMLENLAAAKGFLLNKHGLFDRKSGQYIAGKTEEDIYQHLGMQFIPPELREDNDVIAAAQRFQLPALVSFNKIKGDMHIHSVWGDGEQKISALAHYATNAFPHYEYIVVADHVAGTGCPGGLQPGDFRFQFKEIDAVNESMGQHFVKKGVEISLLEDGTPELPDMLLEKFDWVIATVRGTHKDDNTARLLKACDNPHVHCIGRIGPARAEGLNAFSVDWLRLFEQAAITGTALEINAYPGQLALSDQLLKTAVEKGVYLVIGTDAHTLAHFDYMQLGVGKARRAGCSKEHILNTLPWSEMATFKRRKKNA